MRSGRENEGKNEVEREEVGEGSDGAESEVERACVRDVCLSVEVDECFSETETEVEKEAVAGKERDNGDVCRIACKTFRSYS